MEQLSRQDLDLITAASAELVRIHPELEQRDWQKTTHDFAGKSSRFRKLLAEVADGTPETEIPRHIEELLVLSEGRPAILIQNDNFDLSNQENVPDVILNLLARHRNNMRQAIRGVGRIEVSNHPQRAWIGTGFVVTAPDGSDVVVTNRHVAAEMAYRRPDGNYQFVDGLVGGRTISAFIDFKEEFRSITNDTTATARISEVLHIEEAPGPDLAFLRLANTAGSPAFNRLRLSAHAEAQMPVAAIGYPAKDTRDTDLQAVLALLGNIYNKKRLAPGILKSADERYITHDCSTLGGNSGSPLIDIRSGQVVGVHYGGRFPNPMNYAIAAPLIAEKLSKAIRRR